MNNFTLRTLPVMLKKFLSAILITLSTGILIGILFIGSTTHFSPSGASERFSGSQTQSEFDIPEQYPKSYSEMLLTTHSHVIAFSFISFITGVIFYFNSLIIGKMKLFLIIDPPLSALITFGSIWLVRFVHKDFIYLTIISSVLLYSSIFIMIAVSLFELNVKKV